MNIVELIINSRSAEEQEREFQRQLELANSSDEAELVKLASSYGLDGCCVIHDALRRNPSTTLKVVETAISRLKEYLSWGWSPTAADALNAWRKKLAIMTASNSAA